MQSNSTIIPKSIYKNLSRIYLVVKAKPGNKRQGVSNISDEAVQVCINAPPVDGKANAALVAYFSDIFDLPKSEVVLEKGGTNKHKLISIADCFSEEEVLNILNENLL
jgi:uncharacterized protein (TIGR00251 family)